MKLKALILLLCIWSGMILANGEIARYQDKILEDQWAKLRRTELSRYSICSDEDLYYYNNTDTVSYYFDSVYYPRYYRWQD